MNTNVLTPFPLINVDLNHEPCEFFFPDDSDQNEPCEFFVPDDSDQYPSSRYTLLPQPHPHQGSHHPDHAKSVEHLIIARGGDPHGHPLNEDLVNGKNSIYGHDDDHGRPQEYFPVKWMSSKTRITKKMTGGAKPSAMHDLGLDPNHKASSGIPPRSTDVLGKDTRCSANSNKNSGSWIESNNNNSKPTIIRVCTDCNTTKTPLWRSGPTGPKSLCNACGIRQRKARRAMAAAAVATNGESPPQPNPAQMKVQQKKKKMKNPSDNHPQPMKKPKTLHPPVGSRNPCFEEFLMKLSEWISDFRGVFPQDEKEAAILLMALSHGLVQADNLS